MNNKTFKLIILGLSGIGKTTLIQQLVYPDQPPIDRLQETGIDWIIKKDNYTVPGTVIEGSMDIVGDKQSRERVIYVLILRVLENSNYIYHEVDLSLIHI